MASYSFEDTRSNLLRKAQTLTENESPRSDLQAQIFLNEAVARLPPTDGNYIDPQLAHETLTVQRLLGQTSYKIFALNDEPNHLDAAIAAYDEAVRTGGRYPNPELLMEAIQIYRSHGAHEGALHLCAHIIQDHPTFHRIGDTVMNAISCMIQLKVDIPGPYVQWLCEMPHVEETDALLLTAKAKERRGKYEEARAGYREIFLRLKTRQIRAKEKESARGSARRKNDMQMQQGETKRHDEDFALQQQKIEKDDTLKTLIGNHTKWDLWCEDPNTWIKAGRPWFNRQEYEIANLMLGAALQCSSMPGDECLAKLSVGHGNIGHFERSMYYFKRMTKGKFQKKIIGTHRTYPKFSKVSLRPGSEEDKLRKLVESCYHIKDMAIKQAVKLDDREREKNERKCMKKAEDDMRYFLTDEKIWNACVTIGCSMRMWIAQAELRKRKKSVVLIQAMLRVYIAFLRITRIRGLLRMRATAHNLMYLRKIQEWNAEIRIRRVQSVAHIARRLTTLMAVRRTRTVSEIARRAHAIRTLIDDEVLRRARIKLSTMATLVHSHGRIRNLIQWEKERRAAVCLQRLFRSRLMKQLLMVLSGNMSSYPNQALSLWYRQKLTGMSLMILNKRLTPYAIKIENQFRKRKATKYVKRIRKAKQLAAYRKRQKEIAAERRRKANQARRDALEAQRLKEIRARKRQIAKELLSQLKNPSWEILGKLLKEGSVALGETHELMLRGKRLIRALEKESAHQRYRKIDQRDLVAKRARARKFESVELQMDQAFVAGKLSIVPAPQTPPPNLEKLLTGDDSSPEKQLLMSPPRKIRTTGRARPEEWDNVR